MTWFWLWLIFGALFGGLVAQKRGWNVLAGVFGGAFLGMLSPLLLFVSASGGEKSTRSAGAQLGRGILIALGLIVLSWIGLVAYFRLGGAQ